MTTFAKHALWSASQRSNDAATEEYLKDQRQVISKPCDRQRSASCNWRASLSEAACTYSSMRLCEARYTRSIARISVTRHEEDQSTSISRVSRAPVPGKSGSHMVREKPRRHVTSSPSTCKATHLHQNLGRLPQRSTESVLRKLVSQQFTVKRSQVQQSDVRSARAPNDQRTDS